MYRFDDDETRELPTLAMPEQGTPWWRRTPTFIAAALAVAVLMVVTFVALRPDPRPTAADPGPNDRTSVTGSPSPTASPSPSASPTPTASQAPIVPPAPTVVLPPAEIPPDPEPPASDDPGCSPTFDGPNAPPGEVRQALAAAGAKEYWRGVVLPVNYVGPLVPITVPVNVMNAVAWQESGWQSAIVNCVDGGQGTMQVMPGTVNQLNVRFGMDYTYPLSLQENTEVGANYLQWLMMYFGTKYFGQNFDMYAKGPIDRGVQLELRDVVIAAYNVGPGGVEDLGDPDNPADDVVEIYNWNYVNAVEAFMDSCPCNSI